jgi:hypothetical protein
MDEKVADAGRWVGRGRNCCSDSKCADVEQPRIASDERGMAWFPADWLGLSRICRFSPPSTLPDRPRRDGIPVLPSSLTCVMLGDPRFISWMDSWPPPMLLLRDVLVYNGKFPRNPAFFPCSSLCRRLPLKLCSIPYPDLPLHPENPLPLFHERGSLRQ